MNKYEKQVLIQELLHERNAVKELKQAFSESLKDVKNEIKLLKSQIDELQNKNAEDSLIRSKVYQLNYQQALEESLTKNLSILNTKNVDTISKYLEKVYNDNYLGAIYNLQQKYKIPIFMPVNSKLMVQAIMQPTDGYKFSERLYDHISQLKETTKAEILRGIAQGKSYGEIAKRITEQYNTQYYNAYRIARTEGGRVSTLSQLQSLDDSIEQGADLLKRWDATLDDRTRDVHGYLDGQIVEQDEMFEYPDGQVNAPFEFTGANSAALNINCRCRLSLVPRSSLKNAASTRISKQVVSIKKDKNGKDKIITENKIIEYQTYTEWKNEYLKQINNLKNK